jgi:hypothetical protein
MTARVCWLLFGLFAHDFFALLALAFCQDPRVDNNLNTNFLDMMEQYYEQPTEIRNLDARPEVHYQVGVTPEEVEKARNHCGRIQGLNETEKPLTECPPEKDHKSRFFWRIGPAPETDKHRDLNMPQVVPKAFPQWADTMNGWGEKILGQEHDRTQAHALHARRPLLSLPLSPSSPSWYDASNLRTPLIRPDVAMSNT